MTNQYELVLVFIAVLTGVVSATYFYQSASIFVPLLQRPLKLISGGMFLISIGVLLAAFISYEFAQGVTFVVYGVPLPAVFYVLYIIGSVMIAFGARQFTYRPKKG